VARTSRELPNAVPCGERSREADAHAARQENTGVNPSSKPDRFALGHAAPIWCHPACVMVSACGSDDLSAKRSSNARGNRVVIDGQEFIRGANDY
jgi:hypothetical protein